MIPTREELLEELEKLEAPESYYDECIAEVLGVEFHPYTSSIDAALTLVPDGWTVAGLGFDDNRRWFCELREGFQTSYARVIIANLKSDKQPAAIALCIAALKAHGDGK